MKIYTYYCVKLEHNIKIIKFVNSSLKIYI